MQAATEDDNVALLGTGVVVRRVALAAGEMLVSNGRLEIVDDVFYLEVEELAQALRDVPARTTAPDLRIRIGERRQRAADATVLDTSTPHR